MSFITDLVTGGVDKIVDSVGNGLDKLFTSDAEKLILRNELEKIKYQNKIELLQKANEYDQEISKRHQADMTSDSWLSKNIRPLTLIFILVMYSLLSISSGFAFNVTSAYVELLGQWGMLIMSFYFGSRGFEKIFKIKYKDNNPSKNSTE